MEQQTDDILERLETAVQSWTSEVDEAQRRFGEQLAETRGRIETNAEAALEALQTVMKEQFQELQRRFEDSTDAVRDALSRVDTLEAEVARLKKEIATERETAPAQPIAVQEEDAEEAAAPAAPEERTRKVTIQPFDENGAPRRMGEILVDAGLITREQLDQALEIQYQAPQRKLGSILVEEGFTGEEVIPQVLARQLRIPYLRLKEGAFDPIAVALITGRLAARHACIPLRATDDTLALAMANPLDLIAIEDVERAAGKRVQPLIARESEIMAAIHERYDDTE
jgi:hypothetical protein